MANLALRLCFQRGFVNAIAVTGFGAEGGIVELENIDVVCLQALEGLVQICPEILRVLGGRLGGNLHLIPDLGKHSAKLYFAV